MRALKQNTFAQIRTCSRQFHQRFTRAFFVQKLRFGSFSSYILALAPKFRTKKTRENVDEIDTCAPKRRKKIVIPKVWNQNGYF